MAYLCKQEFGAHNKTGAGMRFESSVYATASGKFIFRNIPDDILRRLIQNGYKITGRDDKTGLEIDKKNDGIKAIKEAMESQLTMTSSSELVIQYSYTANCHYWKMPDGSLLPNGCGQEKGVWNEPIFNNEESGGYTAERSDFTIGFKAEVRKKIAYVCGDSTSVEYEGPQEDELKEWGNKLNAFARVSMHGEGIEIPYTERTAKMFYESMMRLCQISHQLSEFLKEPKNILTGINLMLLSSR